MWNQVSQKPSYTAQDKFPKCSFREAWQFWPGKTAAGADYQFGAGCIILYIFHVFLLQFILILWTTGPHCTCNRKLHEVGLPNKPFLSTLQKPQQTTLASIMLPWQLSHTSESSTLPLPHMEANHISAPTYSEVTATHTSCQAVSPHWTSLQCWAYSSAMQKKNIRGVPVMCLTCHFIILQIENRHPWMPMCSIQDYFSRKGI